MTGNNQSKQVWLIVLIVIMVAIASGGSVYLWQRNEINRTNTPLKLIVSSNSKTGLSSSGNLEISGNNLEIKDGDLIRPVLKMVSASVGAPSVDYKLYLVRKSVFSDDNQPNCNEAVYLQKDKGGLKKVTEGSSCEFTFLADMGFLDNMAKFFFVQTGGDGSVMTLYNLDGEKIKFSDEKNVLSGWNIGSIDEYGWVANYQSTVATFRLWKEIGMQNATVRVDMEKMKVFSETFKNTGPAN